MNTISLLRHNLVALTLALGLAVGIGVQPAAANAAPNVPAPETRALETRALRALEVRLPLANCAPPVRAQSSVLVGGVLQDVVGNRSRLIQVSFVAILIGIFILWKK